jgi:porin
VRCFRNVGKISCLPFSGTSSRRFHNAGLQKRTGRVSAQGHCNPSASAKPGAVNATTGTAELEKYFLDLAGIKDDHGVRIGGLWIGNTNWLMSGGAEPGKVSWDSLFIADLLVDMEKLTGWWKGALLGAEFLRFDGQRTNEQAGSIQGYNGLPGPEPLDRSELYQLWIRQEFFDGKFIVRLGKPCRALISARARPVRSPSRKLLFRR